MRHKGVGLSLLAATAGVVVVILLLPTLLQPATLATVAGWSQSYAGSLISLGVAMLTLVPAFLLLGSGWVESLSALAFVSFFWGRFQQAHDPWAPFLCLLGAAAVGTEILVVPGLGKPFVIGVACLSAAIWKSYPDSSQGMGALLFAYVCLAGGVVAALKLIPGGLFSRGARLTPPDPLTSRFQPEPASLRALVGQDGEAVTGLKPSGKALVSGQKVDVRTRGEFLSAGAALQVIACEANQLIVCSKEAAL